MIKQLEDDPQYTGFVAPHLCDELHKLGLTPNTVYFWKIYDDIILLHTIAFDVDDYNEIATANVDALKKPHAVLPGYTVTNVEGFMPDYRLVRINGIYRLAIDRYFNQPIVKEHERMPDVFALAAIELLKHGLVKPEVANKNIAYERKRVF